MSPSLAAPRFRRAIHTRATPGVVEAEVLDDFHHFGLTLSHREGRVIRVEGWAKRFPWVTCQAAPSALAAFEGVAITPHPLTAFLAVNPRFQCTHLFELAALAIAQASRGEGRRLYTVEVADPVDGVRHAALARDGEPLFDLQADAEVLLGPKALAGTAISALTGRALAAMTPDEGEAWMILRQALRTARGRQMRIPDGSTPADLGYIPACFTGLPENLPHALRVPGSQHDFTAGPAPAHQLLTLSEKDTPCPTSITS